MQTIQRPRLIVPPSGLRWMAEQGRALRDPELVRMAEVAADLGASMVLGTHPYVYGFLNAFNKTIAYTTDAIKVGLSTSAYVPSQAHQHYSDITNEVANGNGYTTGGVALGSPTNTVASSTQTLSGANVSWTSSGAGFTAAFAWGYDSTPGTAATDPLIWYVDLGGNQSVSGGAVLTIAWSGSGIIQTTVS